MKNSKLFSRGFTQARRRINNFIISCYNCKYYYQAKGDDEEMCQNPDVLKYDMVVTDTRIYCNRWEMCPPKDINKKEIFKKKGIDD